MGQPSEPYIAELEHVSLAYKETVALDDISLQIPAGKMVGLIGPDGVGKSSLLALISGARIIQEGHVHVLGGDMKDGGHRDRVCPQIAYMPQGLGKTSMPPYPWKRTCNFLGAFSDTTKPNVASASTISLKARAYIRSLIVQWENCPVV